MYQAVTGTYVASDTICPPLTNGLIARVQQQRQQQQHGAPLGRLFAFDISTKAAQRYFTPA